MSGQQQSLLEVLHLIRAQVESLAAPIESEQLLNIYRTQLTPNLLMLRGKQRAEMNHLESRHRKLKELNRELLNLQEQCDCVLYEASCVGSEVDEVKQEACKSESPMKNGFDSFDPDAIGKLDHETRMRLLDEEEAKRTKLVERMDELSEETKRLGALNAECAAQINDVKPIIKQLLEKVSPALSSKNEP